MIVFVRFMFTKNLNPLKSEWVILMFSVTRKVTMRNSGNSPIAKIWRNPDFFSGESSNTAKRTMMRQAVEEEAWHGR